MTTQRALVITAIALVTSLVPLYGTPPPELPTPLPPQIVLPTPPTPHFAVGVGPVTPPTPAIVGHMVISPTAAHSLLESFASGKSLAIATESASQTYLGTADTAKRFVAAPDATIVQAMNLTCCDDALVEQETTLVMNTIGTTDYTTSAFMLYTGTAPNGVATGNQVVVRSNSSAGARITTQLPSAYGANGRTGDPAIAENPYPPSQSTIGPDRVYIAATDGYASHTPSRLAVWFSDNGGAWFFPAVTVKEECCADANGHHHFEDKPTIAVSWNGGTLGKVYVAAVRIDLDSTDYVHNPLELVIFRSDNGGVSFVPTATLSSKATSTPQLVSNTPHAPQIIVDQFNGNVYLIWLDWNTNMIYAAWSGPDAASWTLLTPFAAGTFLYNSDLLSDPAGGTVQARSMLNGRMNLYSGGRNIGVVWHARESTGLHADVKYNALSLSSNTWIGTRTVSQIVNDGFDQWNGSLDHDGNGTVIVMYYDRRENSTYYRVYADVLNPDGTRPAGQVDTKVTLGAFSDPRRAPLVSVAPIYYTLGEYMDTWWWRDWKSCYIYAPTYPYNGNCGIYESEVNP